MKRIELTKEFLSDAIFNKKMSISQLAKQTNTSRNTISRRLIEFGIQHSSDKKESSEIDLTGRRFQKLLVLSISESKDSRRMWKCECDCGKRRECSTTELIKNRATNCGVCWRTSYKDISGGYFSSVKNNAISRDLEFSISIEYVWDIFESQKHRCALSGEPISFCNNRSDVKNGKQTASIDRIDSSKGYINGNIQIVHKTINMMKRDMTDEEFIKLCNKVTECQKEKR